MPQGAAGMPSLRMHFAEPVPVLGVLDGLVRGAQQGHAGRVQPRGELQRGLAAELGEHAQQLAAGGLPVDHGLHVLEGERLEVEPVGDVEVGAHRLGVAVDQDGLDPLGADGLHRLHAAAVELDALADAVGAASPARWPWAARWAGLRSAPPRSGRGRASPPRIRRSRCPPASPPGSGPGTCAAGWRRPRRRRRTCRSGNR